MQSVPPKTIARVLQITDEAGLHREAVRVPLGPAGDGAVRVEGGVVHVVVPEADVEMFLGTLPKRLAALDLTQVRKA